MVQWKQTHRKEHVGNAHNGSLSPFLLWHEGFDWETRRKKLCNYGDFHIASPTGEKPQTRLQRLEINATLPVPVIPWQHPTAQMETLGNKTRQACLHFPHRWMVKSNMRRPWQPLTFPLESVVCSVFHCRKTKKRADHHPWCLDALLWRPHVTASKWPIAYEILQALTH